jgi:hypothetical protein
VTRKRNGPVRYSNRAVLICGLRETTGADFR